MLSLGIALVSSRIASAQQTVLDLDGRAVNPLPSDSSKVVVLGLSTPGLPGFQPLCPYRSAHQQAVRGERGILPD